MSAIRWTLVFILFVGASLAHRGIKGNKSKDTDTQDISQRHEEPLPNPLNDTTELSLFDISEMNSNFGFNLYRKIADKHDYNIFFSPLSISFNLASLMLGSRGHTYDELLTGLNWEALKKSQQPNLLLSLLKELRDGVIKSEDYDLDLGSLSFVHDFFPLNDEFINETRAYLDMEYRTLDFQDWKAKNIINEFIIKKSRGKVTEFQYEIDPQTKMMLFDFIFFKGKWQIPFKSDSTKIDSFFVSKYQSLKVPMMYTTDKFASMFDKSLSCTVLNLPYRGGAHMMIIMPEKGGDFDAVEDGLSMKLVITWLEKMKTGQTDVFFPKFRLEQTYKLKSFLEELGIKDVFTGNANFTHMTEEKNLKLSEITQRIVIDIDEIGAEGFAFTRSEIIGLSLPHTIRVNKPFMFMIFQKDYKSLLFIGRIVNPTKF